MIHFQPDQHWPFIEGYLDKTPDRQGLACVDFSEHYEYDAILSWNGIWTKTFQWIKYFLDYNFPGLLVKKNYGEEIFLCGL